MFATEASTIHLTTITPYGAGLRLYFPSNALEVILEPSFTLLLRMSLMEMPAKFRSLGGSRHCPAFTDFGLFWCSFHDV